MSGELPEGWRWAKLGEMCDVNPRRPRDLRISPQDQVTFIPMRAVSGEMAEVVSAETRRYEDVARGYTYMEEGDVIFAKITPCMQNGKHAIVHDTLTGVAFGSTEFHVLRAKEEVDPRLIHRFLLRPEFLREAEQNFTGTAGQRRVPKEFLSESPFPVAPLDEQRRIVARLEKQIAAASRAREAAAAQLVAIEGIPAALLREIFPPSPAAR